MKKLTMLTLLGALGAIPVTYADTAKPTLENAHAFIKEMVKQKRLEGYEFIWWGNDIKDFKSQNCETSYTVEHSGPMFVEMIGRTERSKIMIHWGQVSEVTKVSLSHIEKARLELQLGIWIRGSIQENEDSRSSIGLRVNDSDATRDRLIKAMDFIRQHCDTTRKYGF